MKRFFLYFAFAMLIACGCKSHKAVLINSSAEFRADDVWILTQIRGKEVECANGQEVPFLQINPEASTFSGVNGCNKYFGTFKDLGNGKMELSDFNGTKKACPESFRKLENSYMQLFRKCNGYNLGAATLELLQDDKVVLTFELLEQEKE